MADLSVDQTQALLEALGLVATEDDLMEVTHRANVLREALQMLDDPALDGLEPLPVFWLREGK